MGAAGGESGTRDVLIVEDNPVNRDVLVAMLETIGYHAEAASNGPSALSVAGSRPFALILMDIRMPTMDGRETAQGIRSSDGPNAKTPIVAITATPTRAEKALCRAAGIDDVLAKPVPLDELAAVLDRHVGGGASAPAEDAPRREPHPRQGRSSKGSSPTAAG